LFPQYGKAMADRIRARYAELEKEGQIEREAHEIFMF
jgi:hypothetical protein